MRTIKEVLAENPDARFSCNGVEMGAFPSEDILEKVTRFSGFLRWWRG